MASFGTFLATTCLMLLIMAKIGEGGGSVGLNFGRQTSQKLLPSMVVDMLLANGITKFKSFSANEGLMSAFPGTGIQLIVAISNVDMNVTYNNITAKDGVKYWINKYIRDYRKKDVNIRYICVGVEPFSRIDEDKNDPGKKYVEYIIPLMARMETTLQNSDLGDDVKLGVPLSDDTVLEPVSKPSEGDFHREFKDKIIGILDILNRTDSTFMINIYPYLSVVRQRLPLEFGLFDHEGSNFTVIDGDLVYNNVFDVKYDTLVHAMRKYGYGNVKIMVSQVGWPTDGGPGASVKMAKRFYDGFLKKLASNKGTPLLPGAELDVYLHELADENQKQIDRGPFERHYGIYYTDGTPKFNLDFTLQGRDFKLEKAMGVTYMPQRWCILNENATHSADWKDVVEKQKDWACHNSDCTPLADGASCSFLEEHWKVSYAFNQYFQMSNQEVMGDATCDFDGLGMVTDTQPTFEGCNFPVQILSTLFINGESNTEMIATLGMESDGGERLGLAYQLMFIIPLLWIVFLQKGRWLGIHVM